MRFTPGENRLRRGGVTYIKDTVQKQVNPPLPSPKVEKKEIKPKEDEAIQQQQVVQKPVSTGSKPKRRKGRPSSKGNKPSDSGS